MFIDFLKKIFDEAANNKALIWRDASFTYRQLLERLEYWQDYLKNENIAPGDAVTLEADFSPNAVAALLALIEHGCIVIPLTTPSQEKRKEFSKIAMRTAMIRLDSADNAAILHFDCKSDHKLYRVLRNIGHPGLVLFSSGSTGKSKAVVHDFSRLLVKYKIRRHNLRTLSFLLFDHIAGIDTLFYSLSNGSCLITADNRAPDTICRAIEKFRVEVLPVSPTFLNLLILSEAYNCHDLSSLKYITYGTEVMSEMTLKKCAKIFPGVTILQKYGTSEVGTLRSKSKSSDSAWVKIGGEGYQTRIIDGILQIKADSAMLGYLNAESPFTDDGWFVTGDMVEVDGDYMRILGRESEIINVGGQKVFPAEIENVIEQIPNITEAVVYGEKNPLVGQIVCARVTPGKTESLENLAIMIKSHCRRFLENYKVPVKISIAENNQHTDRFKKVRKNP